MQDTNNKNKLNILSTLIGVKVYESTSRNSYKMALKDKLSLVPKIIEIPTQFFQEEHFLCTLRPLINMGFRFFLASK